MGQVRLTKELQSAEQFARTLFLDDPEMSIDTACRIVNDQFERGLHKSAVSQIRAAVRQSINAAMPDREPEPKEEPNSFVNRPRLVSTNKGVEEEMEHRKGRATVDTGIKRTFLGDWATENPLSTIREAREALRKQFGETLGTSYIADTLKAARALVLEHQRKSTPIIVTPERTLREVARDLASVMKSAGIKSLRLNTDGTIDFEASLS